MSSIVGMVLIAVSPAAGLTTENASPDSVRGVRPQGVRLLDIENNRNWLRCSTWNIFQERKR